MSPTNSKIMAQYHYIQNTKKKCKEFINLKFDNLKQNKKIKQKQLTIKPKKQSKKINN